MDCASLTGNLLAMRAFGIVLLLLLSCSLPAAAEGEWPFGHSGRGAMMRGGDYYNLGVLGLKVRDEARPPAGPMQPGMRSGRVERDPRGDVGPDRMAVEILFPGGPADKAGIVRGDVITGVGKRAFDANALETLAGALRKAETGSKKGVLSLRVERGGQSQQIEIHVPVRGKAYKKPEQGVARRAVLDEALAWLAQRQGATGGYSETLSGQNGAVVQTAMAGLAWLAGGSDRKRGPHKENVDKAAKWLRNVIGGALPTTDGAARSEEEGVTPGNGIGGFGSRRMPGLDQTNWGYAHAAIFLGELHARNPSPSVRATLFECAKRLIQTQEKSGGWAHGPGGPNPLGYTELNIVTGLALSGLGLAKKAGYEVPEDTIDRAEQYLVASSGGGGVGYSANAGQKGQGNIGRTACCWLGMHLLRPGKFVTAMKKWSDRNIDKVLGGHASLMQHILLAGVAAPALSKGASKRYWKAMLRDFTLARTPNGSFQPRPWHESLGMGSNSDVTFGEVWTTASWAVVLGCAPDKKLKITGLPAWMGE